MRYLQQESKKQRTNIMIRVSIVLLFIVGTGIFSYPFFADALNNFIDQKMVETFQKQEAQRNKKKREAVLKKLEAENEKKRTEKEIVSIGLMKELFAETDMRNEESKEYYEEHLLGAIYVPKIHISLPLFDITNDALLEKGATLLQGTSYPIGGESTHSVITGHSGRPEKKLFTDLEEVKKGDEFYLEIAGKKLAYQVDRIQVILPDNTDVLTIQEGRDLVTLLTCTPYRVNSHRLLVTGFRIPYKKAMNKKIAKTKNYQLWRLLGVGAAVAAVIGLFLYWTWRKAVLFQASKQHYDLRFFLADKNYSGSFQLLTKKGRPVLQEGRPVAASPDTSGEVVFHNVQGGIYRIVEQKNPQIWPKIKAKIWRSQDQEFILKGDRKLLKKSKIDGKRKFLLYNR